MIWAKTGVLEEVAAIRGTLRLLGIAGLGGVKTGGRLGTALGLMLFCGGRPSMGLAVDWMRPFRSS